MTSFEEERAVECKRLVDEITTFESELNSHEKSFISDMTDRLDKYGDKTRVSDKQYKWIQSIYERVC